MKFVISLPLALSLTGAVALFVVSYMLLPPSQGAPPVDRYGCLQPSYANFAWIHNSSGVMLQASLCAAYHTHVSAWSFAYSSLVSSLSFWRLVSVEMSEGFAVAFFLCLIVPRLKTPGYLKRELTLPRSVLNALMVVALVSFGIFGYAELFNILYANTGYPPFLHLFFVDPQMPFHAALALALACLCFGIVKARYGLSIGVKSGVLLGGFAVMVAQLCILLFDNKEMHLHVADFTSSWILFGFPILSNWSVLIVSSFLAFLGAKK
jgi:hypothetical protein